jgi:hypothetical protein
MLYDITSSTLGLVFTIVSLAALYILIIYPTFLSPMAKMPAAHILARYTSLWMLWIRYDNREINTIHAAHQELGPVVLLGPNEVSINCVEGGTKTVYVGDFQKHKWYTVFANFNR